jgi:putative sterol carrier protein
MAHKFPSDEWVKAVRELLNSSDSYQRSAKDWEGDFIFVVEPDEAYADTAYLYLQLYHGSSPGAAMADPENLPETEYVINAPFSTWRKVIDGKLDPIQGMMTGQLKLKGNLMKIMRYPKAAQEIVACCAKIPTDW